MNQILNVSNLTTGQLVKIIINKKTIYCKVAYKEKHDTIQFLKSNSSIKNIIDSAVIFKIQLHIIYPLSETPFTDFPVQGLTKSSGKTFYSFDILQQVNEIFIPILHSQSQFKVFESSKDEIENLIDKKVQNEMTKNQKICDVANNQIKDMYAKVLKNI